MTTVIEQKFLDLAAQLKSTTDAEASAVLLINGILARIEAAVAKAIAEAGGVNASQLQAITDTINSLKASSDGLAAATVANTVPV